MDTTTVESFKVFPDASGAPAVIRYGRLAYSFDMLGELRVHGLKSGNASRRERAIAVAKCTARYKGLLAEATTADWLALNRGIYSGAE